MFGGVYLARDECEEIGGSFTHVLAAISHNNPNMSESEVQVAGLGLWAFVHGLADLTIEGLITSVPIQALSTTLGRVLAQPNS